MPAPCYCLLLIAAKKIYLFPIGLPGLKPVSSDPDRKKALSLAGGGIAVSCVRARVISGIYLLSVACLHIPAVCCQSLFSFSSLWAIVIRLHSIPAGSLG